jgi:hypothetical protein
MLSFAPSAKRHKGRLVPLNSLPCRIRLRNSRADPEMCEGWPPPREGRDGWVRRAIVLGWFIE